MSEVSSRDLTSGVCNKVKILKFQGTLLFYNSKLMPAGLFTLLPLPVHYAGKNLIIRL